MGKIEATIMSQNLQFGNSCRIHNFHQKGVKEVGEKEIIVEGEIGIVSVEVGVKDENDEAVDVEVGEKEEKEETDEGCTEIVGEEEVEVDKSEVAVGVDVSEKLKKTEKNMDIKVMDKTKVKLVSADSQGKEMEEAMGEAKEPEELMPVDRESVETTDEWG